MLTNKFQMLEEFLPGEYVPVMRRWLSGYRLEVKAVKDRSTKLGDYRSPHKGKPHRITVNRGLKPYSFLITLVHEFAHLLVWEKHKNRVKPHGKQWKETYSLLLKEILNHGHMPDEIEKAVRDHSMKITASSYSDHELIRVLRRFEEGDRILHLEDIPERSLFRLKNGKTFIKGKKARKRYLCKAYLSKREYYVSAVAEVEMVRKD